MVLWLDVIGKGDLRQRLSPVAAPLRPDAGGA